MDSKEDLNPKSSEEQSMTVQEMPAMGSCGIALLFQFLRRQSLIGPACIPALGQRSMFREPGSRSTGEGAEKWGGPERQIMPQEFTPDIIVFLKLNLNGFVMNRVLREGLTREGKAEKLMQDGVTQGRLPRGRGSIFPCGRWTVWKGTSPGAQVLKCQVRA